LVPATAKLSLISISIVPVLLNPPVTVKVPIVPCPPGRKNPVLVYVPPLASIVPDPVVTPARLCIPLRSSVAPEAIIKSPECVIPPTSNIKVPALTLIVPLLSNVLLKVSSFEPPIVKLLLFVTATATPITAALLAEIAPLLTILPLPVMSLSELEPPLQLLTPPMVSALSRDRVSLLRLLPKSKPPFADKLPIPLKAKFSIAFEGVDVSHVVLPVTITFPVPPKAPC